MAYEIEKMLLDAGLNRNQRKFCKMPKKIKPITKNMLRLQKEQGGTLP